MDETGTASAFAMYSFMIYSLAASEGRSLIDRVFCIWSGFYPESNTKMQIKYLY